MASYVLRLLCCFLAVAGFVRFAWSSSIYVGRHASGSKVGQQQNRKACEDFSARKCQKIIKWYSNNVCDSSSWAPTLRQLCPRSCGLCDCQDKLGRLCQGLRSYCGNEGETGAFLKQNCPKTCNTCHLTNPDEKGEQIVAFQT